MTLFTYITKYLFGVTELAEDEWEKDWDSMGTLPILKHSKRPLISLQINNHTEYLQKKLSKDSIIQFKPKNNYTTRQH